MLSSTSKSVKSQRILFLGSLQVWEWVSLLVKVMFQAMKELISVPSSLVLFAKKLCSNLKENLFLVNQRIIIMLISSNPEHCLFL